MENKYPPLPGWLNVLGEAYARSGRREQALATWRRSLEVDPDQTQLRQVVDAPPWLEND